MGVRLAGIIVLMLTLWPNTLMAAPHVLSFEQVVDKAKDLASHPFKERTEIPDFLKNISYDQFRDIRFKNEDTLWGRDREPFKVRFFHPGFYYRWPVTINYVDSAGVHRFAFAPDLFDYGKNDFKDKVPADLGFAGFRIHYPINTPSYADEIAVFLGASYFRSLGRGELYGLSARGLAIDTALDTGEEFPFFKEFWIFKPGSWDKRIRIYALMDSQSLSGAYEFIIQPGLETLIHVKNVLFLRKAVKKLGVAPLTSMFFYGENSRDDLKDGLRPEVHDSDGLSILSRTGEWIWRPLVNPKSLLVNTFSVGTPEGFGLFQRDVNFDHYQDLESRFDLRPSLWVGPDADWGSGHVELLQIPSDTEKNDNIGAFWVPDKPTRAGDSLSFSYTLHWGPAAAMRPPEGYVRDTRISHESGDTTTFVIDFEGKQIESLQDLTADIRVASDDYTLGRQQVFKNTVTGGWRLVFEIKQKKGALKDVVPAAIKPAVGLRAFLKKDSHAVTETWDYAYAP